MISTLEERFEPVLEEARAQVLSGLRPSIQIAVDWQGRRCADFAVGHEPTSPSARYLLWSTTKPFVAIALLQLIEAGQASLDDRVTRFLPEFGQGGKESATLAHVLTHRGGFPDNDAKTTIELARIQSSWDEALRYVCEMPARWEPGTDRGYHPRSGWFVLGEVIQRITSLPLTDVVRQRVLEPVGIDPQGFSLGDPARLDSPPLTVRTAPRRGSPSEREAELWSAPKTLGAVIPGAGGISSANQVIRFFRDLLDTLRTERAGMLSPAMARCATFPHAVGIRDRTFLLDIPWGLGMHLKHVRASLDDCGQTATPGTFGHGGHFLVNTAWADPGKNLVFCTLSNGLAPAREGRRGVERLSQAVHDVVDHALDRA